MAANLRNLSVLVYGNGFTLWHYRCHDGTADRDGSATLAEVTAKGFFDPAAASIEDGDIILVSASDGGGGYFCTRLGSGKVRIAPLAGN